MWKIKSLHGAIRFLSSPLLPALLWSLALSGLIMSTSALSKITNADYEKQSLKSKILEFENPVAKSVYDGLREDAKKN